MLLHCVLRYFGVVFDIFPTEFYQLLILIYFDALKNFFGYSLVVFKQGDNKISKDVVLFGDSRQQLLVLKLLKGLLSGQQLRVV